MADDCKDLVAEQCRQALAVEKTLGRVTLLAMAFALFGMVPLRGLPGLLIFDLFEHTLISILPGSHTWCRFYPDTLLPFTLCVTFLWPISLPVGYAIAFKKFRAYPKAGQALIWLAITVLWGALLSVGLCLTGARASASMTWLERALIFLATVASTADFRFSVVRAYENGQGSQRQLARLFGVSVSFVQNLLQRYRRTGSVVPKPYKGGSPGMPPPGAEATSGGTVTNEAAARAAPTRSLPLVLVEHAGGNPHY